MAEKQYDVSYLDKQEGINRFVGYSINELIHKVSSAIDNGVDISGMRVSVNEGPKPVIKLSHSRTPNRKSRGDNSLYEGLLSEHNRKPTLLSHLDELLPDIKQHYFPNNVNSTLGSSSASGVNSPVKMSSRYTLANVLKELKTNHSDKISPAFFEWLNFNHTL